MFVIGTKYANWEVLSSPIKRDRRIVYSCKCICGAIHEVRTEVLRKAVSTSCRNCMYKTDVINIGDKFGKWEIIQEIKTEEKRKIFIVKCKCGYVRTQKAIRLRFGDSTGCRSCGLKKHGQSGSPTYSTWESMVQRCNNKNNSNFKHYGLRGIKICDSWLNFENFLSDMGERPEGKELDRIDNDGNYEKINCRWITHQENLKNRKRKLL